MAPPPDSRPSKGLVWSGATVAAQYLSVKPTQPPTPLKVFWPFVSFSILS